MSIIDSAKDRVTHLAANVVNKVGEHAPTDATTGQSVTVRCTVVQAEELWRDAHRMSMVLGDLGDVEVTGPDRYRWTFHVGPATTTWESQVHTENGGLRFVGTDDGDTDPNEIIVTFRPAPNHLGTEMTLRTKSPAPDLLSGAMAFKVVYRCRALLQTGEVPTIKSNPSARDSAR
ncbi:hypothetical protein E4P42_00655 [Mycobacterium sp. PS03-16]|uniref:hypothetical protein n=1 Tax=Mycobacterium sp. PS03-16 TaxID=2559611 RepID=UPI0010735953|nr:hypothetical protein [Mycobacterium sp. PS03-16]TFV61446.1 hypothetical protein E4P42_00655 [Mycobacterium sp. PS03-16]